MARFVSLASGCMLDTGARDAVEAAAAGGFDGVGLRLSGEHHLDGDGRARLRRRVEDHGLSVFDVEVHRIGAHADSPAELIDAAADVGARHLLVVSDDPSVAATIDRLGQVVEECARAGIRAAIEYTPWTTPSTPAGAVDVAAASGAAIVADLLHHVRVGATPADLAAVVASGRLGWVQLCDAAGAAPDDLPTEARHHRLPPGDGDLPLEALLAVVPAEIPVSVEVQSDSLATTLPPADRARALHRAASTVLS